MKRIYRIIVIALALLFVGNNKVLADFNGNGRPSGGGATATGSGSWDKNRYGYYIRFYRSNHTEIKSIRYPSYTDCGYFWNNVYCHKTNNFYCVTGDTSEPYCDSNATLYGWITCSGSSCTADPTVLYRYLDIPYSGHNDDYAAIKNIIKNENIYMTTGYYIIVEPFARIYEGDDGRYHNYTMQDVVDKAYSGYYSVVQLLGLSAGVGSDITVGGHKYKASGSNCNLNSSTPSNNRIWCGNSPVNGYYSGYGLVVISYENLYPNKSFYIVKKDARGKNLSGATFYLYENSSRTQYYCVSQSDGKCTFNDIPIGKTYTIRETNAPTGYKPADSSKVVATVNTNTVVSGSNVGPTNGVKNEDGCGSLFNYYNNDGTAITMAERIQIYNKFKSEDLRGLLNTNNKTAATACVKITPSYTRQATCFGGNYNNRVTVNNVVTTFNSSNISTFNEEIEFKTTYGTEIKGFCLVSATLDGDGTTQSDTKSGTLLYNRETATQATLTKKCYLYYASNYSPYSAAVTGVNLKANYNSYIRNVNLSGINNSNSEIPEYTFANPQNDVKTENINGSSGIYTYTYNWTYSFPEIWVTRGRADTYHSESACTSANPTSVCVNLGHGLVTKFTSGYKQFKFSYEFCKNNCGKENQEWEKKSGTCNFKLTPPPNDNDLEIEFRTIKVSNPFPGKSGNGRKVGSNWKSSDGNNNSNCNETVLSTITYRPDSSGYGYDEAGNRKKVTARYTIVLTPSIIKDIREDNKTINYEYDKFEQTVYNSQYDMDVNRYLNDLKNRYSDNFKYDYWDNSIYHDKNVSIANTLAEHQPNSCLQQEYLSSTDEHTANDFTKIGYLVDNLMATNKSGTKLTTTSTTGITYSNLNGTCITDNDSEKGYWLVYNLNNNASLNPTHKYYLKVDMDITKTQNIAANVVKLRFSNYYHLNSSYNNGKTWFSYGNVVRNENISKSGTYSILIDGSTQSNAAEPCDTVYSNGGINSQRNCEADYADAVQIGTMPRANGITVCFKNLVVLDLTEYFGAGHEPTKEWLDSNISLDNFIRYTVSN